MAYLLVDEDKVLPVAHDLLGQTGAIVCKVCEQARATADRPGEKAKRLYVIGPVTGKPNENRQAFERARKLLQAVGYEVWIPQDCISRGTPWAKALKSSVSRMLEADGVALLPGWEYSQGANIERGICLAIGTPEVMTVEEWIKAAQ